jgi:hypothetical protein
VHFISQPVNREIPDSRPFDLRIAGVSYFQFNKIYELGTPNMVVRGGASRGQRPAEDEMLSAEERRMIAQAKLESLKDLDKQKEKGKQAAAPPPAALPREEESLIDFGPPDPPQPLPMPLTHTNPSFTSEITLDTAIDDRRPPPALMPYQPYGMPPAPPGGVNYGFAANPYAMAPSPYAPAPYGQAPAPQYGSQAPYSQPSPFSTTSGSSAGGALTPYQPPAGQPAPSPYAVVPPPVSAPAPFSSYGTPQQQPTSYGQPQQQPFGAQSQSSSYGQPYPYGGGNPYGAPPPAPSPMTPSGQSYSGQSFASFGSAPSFAQPPKPPSAPGYNYGHQTSNPW